MAAAMDNVAEIVKWATHVGVGIALHNHGHHFVFTKPPFSCDWWPSTAKCVFGKDFDRPYACHDWLQVAQHISKRLSIEPPQLQGVGAGS